jgi:hypothetical protein
VSRKREPPVRTEFSFDHQGEELAYSKYVSKETGRIDVLMVPRYCFRACPICLEPDPDVAEHVPPESLGGRVMTWTCQKCNNDFGPAEDKLRSFIDLETTAHAEASDGSVPGKRAAKVAFRSSDGRPNGMFIRSAATGFDEIMGSGASRVIVQPLDMALVHASLLKHAYLAACLTNREIPRTAEADEIRAVLLAARDRDTDGLNRAQLALGFEPAVGWIEAPDAPPILLTQTKESGELHWIFMLGGRFVVQWPFRDGAPAVGRPVADEKHQSLDAGHADGDRE